LIDFLTFAYGDARPILELRCVDQNGYWRSGRYSDLTLMADTGEKLQRLHGYKASYYGLNGIDPLAVHVGAPGINSFQNPRSRYPAQACDGDATARLMYLLDSDPVRAKGTASTDAERRLAAIQAAEVIAFFSAEGWPRPVRVDSGNGRHTYYRGDGCSPKSEEWRYILRVLAERYDTAS
jgi:hypothetical protein